MSKDDYRAYLEELALMEQMYDEMEYELELQQIASWKLIYADQNICVYKDMYGAVRTIGAAYIDRMFKTK